MQKSSKWFAFPRNKDQNNAVPGSYQVVQKGTLDAVARSIQHCVAGMSPWEISDLTLGLYKVASRHALEGISDSFNGSLVSNKQELEEILYWLNWAWASYLVDAKAITEFLHIGRQQLKKHVHTSAILKPAYFIAVDGTKKCVVLSIRGTYAATDVLTDLQPHSEQFEGGHAHSGILSAAHWILGNENDNLQILLSENPGFNLVLTGHSLGAGAACLLSYLLRESVGCENKQISSRLGVPSCMIECWGFGCPPCIDKKHSDRASFIKNIVLQDDIVARASVAALEELRSEILQTNWEDVLEDGGIAKRMLGLVNSTNAALGNVEQLLGYPQGAFLQQAKSLSYAAIIESFRAAVARSRGGSSCPPRQYNNAGHYGQHGRYRPYALPGQYGPFGPPVHHVMGNPYGRSYFQRNGARQNLTEWISNRALALRLYWNTPGNSSIDPAGINGGCADGGRLFVPGILYHIKRCGQEAGVATKPNQARAMRHYVIKCSDPNARFMKIVLSKSLLSDHSLASYKDAIEDAIKLKEEYRTL